MCMEDTSNNLHDDFDQWVDMWDQATQGDDFKSTPKMVKSEDEIESDPYWNNMEMLTEAEGKTPNPVYPDSLGKDSKRPRTVKSDKRFAEIEKLKRKIFELECDLLHKEAGGGKWQSEAKLKKDADESSKNNLEKVKKMKKEFDDLCNELGFNDETEKSVYGYSDEEVTK